MTAITMPSIKQTTRHSLPARNHLLQRALREAPVAFPIESEYPIVLAPEGLDFSYAAMTDEGTLVCHANLWPRTLVDRTFNRRFPVALIGNVATDAAWRGRGLMRQLFDHLATEAGKQGLVAAFLWSDLTQFYQNLGFNSLSREIRYWLTSSRLAAMGPKASPLRWAEAPQASLGVGALVSLNRLRGAVDCTLERTPQDFQRLLAIPETKVFVGWQGKEPAAYFVVGKGIDMAGVAHEWGGRTPQDLLGGVWEVCRTHGLGELMLLCPEAASPPWHHAFRAASQHQESHAMAHVKVYQDVTGLRHALGRAFIWGLDSI